MNIRLISIILLAVSAVATANGDKALDALMDRTVPGLSKKVNILLKPDTIDYFTIDTYKGAPRITAADRVSAAMGLHTYLKRYAGIQLTWDCMTAPLPAELPLPTEPLTMRTHQQLRYYLNYCTHSYSMPFWDMERWQREIDWMALHGINAPLAMTGTDAVWDATLRRLGYPEDKITEFIAAPAYQAWWLMNNLEGEGTRMTRRQLDRQTDLQRGILAAMRQLDMGPVLPGYSGMVPSDASTTLGLSVSDPGKWCGYRRPAFLLPTDTDFARIAQVYYEEQQRIFGPAHYYSMDPFHEGGNTKGVNLAEAARAIERAMHEASPGSVWLIQGWQENPRRELLEAVAPENMTVLDLHAETSPQWSARGHAGHPWAWCMLLNFGGNIGLHGKFAHVADDFMRACASDTPPTGFGLTMEGIENNPMMYELASDLPWMSDVDQSFNSRKWLRDYLSARYGRQSAAADSAWAILASSIYAAPASNRQQGTTESPFCARPSDHPVNASAWAKAEPYYDGRDVIRAARLLGDAAGELADNPHYRYDLVDVTRQAVAEAARIEAAIFGTAAESGDTATYRAASHRFMNLMMIQDSLLATHPDFRLGHWTEQARATAADPADADAMERDARTLITTWGSREVSEKGRLHDYANREWQGLLADFYAPRWRRWFAARLADWGEKHPDIDFYEMESTWAAEAPRYSAAGVGDPVETAHRTIRMLLRYL